MIVDRERKERGKIAVGYGPRGFLSNYPPDVVYVVDGRPITKGDILDGKRARQRRRLDVIRATDEVVKPCFVWVFRVDGFAYYGWNLYVRTLKQSWWVSRRNGGDDRICRRAMQLFPCGYLPLIENLKPWMIAFAEQYHWPTRKRPENQGLAVARVRFDRLTGQLLDISSEE